MDRLAPLGRRSPGAGDRGSPGERPVTVVGAGPAGLACAIVLARAGRPVVVREWHSTVGSRFHGDFQGLENWSAAPDVLEELSAAGIEPSFDCHPVDSGTAFDAWGRAYPVRAARPLYYLVRRGRHGGSLEFGLLKQAVAAGATVRFGERAHAVEGPGVFATGPHSADAIAVGYLFETDLPDGNWIAFNDRLAPLGYAYLLIHGGEGTVATCLFTDFKRQAEYVARTLAFFRATAGLEMRAPRPFGGYANFRLPRSALQGGHPVVGEQAGFQDALAGFGLRLALRSGILAARSLIDGSDYRQLWRRELLPLLRAGVSNRFLFNAVGAHGRRWALRSLSGTQAGPQADSQTDRRLRRLYGPSMLTRLVYPLARLRYRAPLADPSCDHQDCACVWCTHGRSGAARDRVPAPFG